MRADVGAAGERGEHVAGLGDRRPGQQAYGVALAQGHEVAERHRQRRQHAEQRPPRAGERPESGGEHERLDAAERLVAAVDEAGVGTVVLLSMRYADAVKEFLGGIGAIGRPLGGRVAWVSGALKPESPFATPWRLERGALLDLGPHAIDLIDAALGPVVSVTARGDLNGMVSLILEHDTGATSTASLCATAAIESKSGIEVYGEDGELVLDLRAAADATSMMNVPAALAARARGQASDAPDIHRGLHLQRIISDAEAQLR